MTYYSLLLVTHEASSPIDPSVNAADPRLTEQQAVEISKVVEDVQIKRPCCSALVMAIPQYPMDIPLVSSRSHQELLAMISLRAVREFFSSANLLKKANHTERPTS